MKLITSILFTMLAGMVLGAAIGVNPLIMGGGLTALGAIPKGEGLILFNFADLTWSDGAKNMGGLKTIGYYALISDIETFPELPTNPSSAAEEVTLDGSFVMKAGKYFHKLYTTMETSEIKDEVQGEIDGQSFKHSAEIFFPGTSTEALAFAANVNNSSMVFVFQEASGTNWRVIGSVAFPARCKASFTTGKATADRKGMTMEIFSYGYTPAPLYDGVITLSGEVVS